jgi:hypothetical protein
VLQHSMRPEDDGDLLKTRWLAACDIFWGRSDWVKHVLVGGNLVLLNRKTNLIVDVFVF